MPLKLLHVFAITLLLTIHANLKASIKSQDEIIFRHLVKAQDGIDGGNSDLDGRNAENLVIDVPVTSNKSFFVLLRLIFIFILGIFSKILLQLNALWFNFGH